MNDNVKELMKELGEAINASLVDSDRIAEVIGQIKRAGYDTFLILEATIGYTKQDGSEEMVDEKIEPSRESVSKKISRRKKPEAKLTQQDQKFLRAIKISYDDDPVDP